MKGLWSDGMEKFEMSVFVPGVKLSVKHDTRTTFCSSEGET
jgi:hypothetical protein